MEIVDILQQFGISGGMLFVFYVLMKRVVEYFIASNERCEKSIEIITSKFVDTIDNHIAKNTDAVEKNTDVLHGLATFCQAQSKKHNK